MSGPWPSGASELSWSQFSVPHPANSAPNNDFVLELFNCFKGSRSQANRLGDNINRRRAHRVESLRQLAHKLDGASRGAFLLLAASCVVWQKLIVEFILSATFMRKMDDKTSRLAGRFDELQIGRRALRETSDCVFYCRCLSQQLKRHVGPAPRPRQRMSSTRPSSAPTAWPAALETRAAPQSRPSCWRASSSGASAIQMRKRGT